ncbi:MAG: Phytoene dehydrogenase, partial [uncultured Solirubrobacteraceae bacterium]
EPRRRHRRGPRRPRRGPASAGHGPRRHRGRAARHPGRPRVADQGRRLHVGHGPLARHDAVGPGGGLRRGRPGLPPRGHAPRARPLLPDHVDGRGPPPGLRARPGGDGRRDRALLPTGRRGLPPLHGGDAAHLRGRDPRRGPPALRLARPARRVHAPDGQARRGAAAPPGHVAVLRAPADPRGVLLPLPVHRRRPVPGARDLRRARLPAVPRRRLVRRRRRLRDHRGDGPGARRALRGRRGAHRDRARARDRGRDPRRRADPGRRRRDERRRPPGPRDARAAQAPAAHGGVDVGVPALPGHRPPVPPAPAPHAARGLGLQGVHQGRHAPRPPAAHVLHVRPRPEPHGARDGGRGRRLPVLPAARAAPGLGDRLGPGVRPAARRGRAGPRDDVRARRPGRERPRRAPDDARRLPRPVRRPPGQRLGDGAHAPPVRRDAPAQPRQGRAGPVPRRRRHAPRGGDPRRAARRRGDRGPRGRGPPAGAHGCCCSL